VKENSDTILLGKSLFGTLDLLADILDGIPDAILWELDNCRIPVSGFSLSMPATLPDFGNETQLAKKSLGHALPSACILLNSPHPQAKKELEFLLEFFEHYLIMRQLNDDAHDWLIDLEKGRLNPVNVLVLKIYREQMQSKRPTRKIGSIDIANEKASLQTIFWEQVLDATVHRIAHYASCARKAIAKMNAFTSTQFMEDQIRKIEGASSKARDERDRLIKFLDLYHLKNCAPLQ
jgi:hypothetical protein